MLLLCSPQPPLPRRDQQGDSYNPRQTTCLQDHPKFLRPLCHSCSPVWQQWSHRWSCSSRSPGRTTRSFSSSAGPQRASSKAEGRSRQALSLWWDTRALCGPLWSSLHGLTCGLMLCGIPASTRERSFSERGREVAILSQVRSPTSWLWVNSRWACHRSRCGGSSIRDTVGNLPELGSAPSARRAPR